MVRVGRGLKKLFKWTFILALLGVLGLYGYVRYDYASAASRLARLEAEAAELDLPLDPEDMAIRPAVPVADNAAPFYRRFAAELKARKDLKSDMVRAAMEGAMRPGEAELRRARPVVAQLSPLIDVASQASTKAGCDFERDWSLGPDVMFPEFANQKDAAKWLCTRALTRARSGDLEGGLKDLEAAGKIGGHIGREKSLISGLVMIAIDAITIAGIESLASYKEHDIATLRSLREALENLPDIPHYSHFLEGEVFFGYYTARHLDRFWKKNTEAEEWDWDSSMGVPRIVVLPPFISSELVGKAYAAKSLEYWTHMFRLIRSEKYSAAEIGRKMDVLARDYEGTYRPSDVLNTILMPVFAQAGQAFEKAEANRRMAIAMIDVLLHKRATGHYPKTLEEIGIRITDPYDGKPIRYRLTETGFRIYSIGSDREDDGGFFGWEKSWPSYRLDQPIAAHPAWERYAPRPVTVAAGK